MSCSVVVQAGSTRPHPAWSLRRRTRHRDVKCSGETPDWSFPHQGVLLPIGRLRHPLPVGPPLRLGRLLPIGPHRLPADRRWVPARSSTSRKPEPVSKWCPSQRPSRGCFRMYDSSISTEGRQEAGTQNVKRREWRREVNQDRSRDGVRSLSGAGAPAGVFCSGGGAGWLVSGAGGFRTIRTSSMSGSRSAPTMRSLD